MLHSGIEKLTIVQTQHLPHLGGRKRTALPDEANEMAYTSNLSASRPHGLVERIGALITRFWAHRARKRAYTQTFRELSALSNHELADLGLGRSDIRRVAHEAAYGTQ